ncbi:sulfatase family protein [Aureliella helgolandensis]|uniref:Arylsulfatase n=1 Tax=Aureliella helgolandensis TaxID=2527968 RepID=A0A518GGB9_9BACT|nr:sulfatase [Aureliella helgolandensis]QDV27641.1 Arylsulfatase [Aureliella helgolandensis]
MTHLRHQFFLPIVLSLISCTSGYLAGEEQTNASKTSEASPNFVVLFADDLGYADLNCFGGEGMQTPHLDAMARGGMRLTSFYASQAVCSASRSSLLTGCYNVRIGILGALGPGSKTCLNPAEQTIAEVLKPQGYKTAIFGKWHLGDRGVGLPTQHGFDEYHGLPYSNDMWPYHPTSKSFPALPLYANETIINPNVTAEDQQQLTKWATEHAVDFIDRHKAEPFLLYVPYSMPHVPLYVSEEFEDATGGGLFKNVIAEIDWSVGEILAKLKAEGLQDNTLVLFTSDNGPWLSYGDHAGSALPLREGKGTAWEGGQREPTIAYWPGTIPAGSVCDEVAGTIDVLPTIAKLAGASLPERKIDGQDISPLLTGAPEATSPHEAFYYYWSDGLHAVRSGKWKLHFPHSYRSLKGEAGSGGRPGPYQQLHCGLELYNLEEDIGETRDVSAEHPDIVLQLSELGQRMRLELGDSLTKTPGTANRPAGRL